MEKLIEKAMNLMQCADRYGIEEVLLEDGAQKIHFGRNLTPPKQPVSMPTNSENIKPGHSVVEANGISEVTKPIENIKLKTITSPMVGTFYRAPSPGSEPFAAKGKAIQEGEVVCIVEAMKIMNQIKSPHSGVVRSVLIEDATVVTKGQVLFEIE